MEINTFDDNETERVFLEITTAQLYGVKRNFNAKRETVYNAANYFVHLYDKTARFEANPVKIQKLLFIAALTYYYCFEQTFLPYKTIYRCTECGFKIEEVLSCIRNYISGGVEDNAPLSDDIVKKKVIEYKKSSIPFFDEFLINQSVSNVICETFISFASYSPFVLGEYLNEFKTEDFINERNIPFDFTEDEFNKLLFDIDNMANNPIAEFIISYRKKVLDECVLSE